MQLCLTLILCLLSVTGWAHQSTVDRSEKKVQWLNYNPSIGIINNSSSLPAGTTSTLIQQSIAQWNSASDIQIQVNAGSNNQITFLNDFSQYGSAVIGVTEVSYNTQGTILGANIFLNEQDYDFSATPIMPLNNLVFLGDVVTHELGHFLGLAHSEVLNSSMFYSTYPGQVTVAADDKAGVVSKYNANYGRISGYIKGGNSVGVLGAHVQAFSRLTGQSVSATSDETGFFEITGLSLNDSYYLYISPLKNLSALPGYYANTQNEFCPARYVGSFYSACGPDHDGYPHGITLTTLQPEVDAGIVSVNCATRTHADYNYQKIQTNFSQLTIWEHALENQSQKAFVGFFRKAQLNKLTFTGLDKFKIDLRDLTSPKQLTLRLISQGLGNTVEYSMVVKRNGGAITGSPFTKNSLALPHTLDLAATAALSVTAGQNVFEVELQARLLDEVLPNNFSIPDPSTFGTDQHMPYLLVMSLSSAGSILLDSQSYLSDNASCLDAPFTYAVAKSQATNGDETSTKSQTAAASMGGACGTIEPPDDQGPGSFMLLFSISLLLTFILASMPKRLKNFLS